MITRILMMMVVMVMVMVTTDSDDDGYTSVKCIVSLCGGPPLNGG